MATEAVAAAGAAIALYWWRRERVLCGAGGQNKNLRPQQDPVRFSKTHQPPSTWMEVTFHSRLDSCTSEVCADEPVCVHAGDVLLR